jgi:uncharacterized protein YycO
MIRGDIFLYSGKGIIPHLVKKITKSKWSHCGWVAHDNHIVEANATGIDESNFPYKIEKCAIIRLKLPKDQLELCVQFAEKQEGAPYDYRLFFGLFWRWMMGWKRKADLPDWPCGYICSELVAEPLFKTAGFNFNPSVNPQNIVPEDIWQYAVLNPDKVEIIHIGSAVKS